jgi:hypothetical protein
MRRGELLGLKWEDIDLEGHRLFVRRALWRGKFVAPKSRRSRHTIDVAPTLRDALARLPSRFRGDLVFCSEAGTALDPDNLMHRDFPRALRRAGVRRIRFHDLRHTYTSLLIAHGAHPKYIQVQLGHASIQTTLDRYGHLMPDAHTAEARKLMPSPSTWQLQCNVRKIRSRSEDSGTAIPGAERSAMRDVTTVAIVGGDVTDLYATMYLDKIVVPKRSRGGADQPRELHRLYADAARGRGERSTSERYCQSTPAHLRHVNVVQAEVGAIDACEKGFVGNGSSRFSSRPARSPNFFETAGVRD